MSETKIVYTPWENLKKTADMVVGQIGYHNHKRCKVKSGKIVSARSNKAQTQLSFWNYAQLVQNQLKIKKLSELSRFWAFWADFKLAKQK